jgi:hypothetical protein
MSRNRDGNNDEKVEKENYFDPEYTEKRILRQLPEFCL